MLIGTRAKGENVSEIQSLTLRVRELSEAVDFWNVVLLWGLAIAALAAVVIGISTRLVFVRAGQQSAMQQLLDSAKDRQLKSDLKAKDLEIGKAQVDAGEANKKALQLGIDLEAAKAETKERQTELEVEQRITSKAQEEAAKAQIELKQQADVTFRRTVPRDLSIDRAKFLQKLDGVPPSNAEILYKPNDDEAYMLGLVIAGLLRERGWSVSEPRPVSEEDDLKIPAGSWGNEPENVPLTMRAGGGVNGVAVIVRDAGPTVPDFFESPSKATGGWAVLFALQWSGVPASSLTHTPKMPGGVVRVVIGSANN
jgi:hypothetical protein